MKYDILKDFKGSQDGRFTEQFTAGTQADLSEYLVSCLPADHVRVVDAQPELPIAAETVVDGGQSAPIIDNKAIATDGDKPRRNRAK